MSMTLTPNMAEIYNKKGRKARIQSNDTTVIAGKM
jgi:hypothetical protein